MAWSAACSSGEEPYSLAMTLAEFLEDKPGWRFKILATDLDTAMLTKASQGEYDEKALAPVEPALRQKYFDRIKKDHEALYRVKPELRSAITFRKFNLMNQSYPFKVQLDLILCRNVLIYFDADDKVGILRRMHRILKPRGLIFVGHSESLMMAKELFTYVEAAVYQKA